HGTQSFAGVLIYRTLFADYGVLSIRERAGLRESLDDAFDLATHFRKFYFGGCGTFVRLQQTFVEIFDLDRNLSEFIGNNFLMSFRAFNILSGRAFLRLERKNSALYLNDQGLKIDRFLFL